MTPPPRVAAARNRDGPRDNSERLGTVTPPSRRRGAAVAADDNLSVAGEEDPGAALDTSGLRSPPDPFTPTGVAPCAAAQRVETGPRHLVRAPSRPAPPEISDSDLAYMAQAVLVWNRALPPGAVRVRVEGGWLTLSGEVRWHCQRQDAVNCVRDLPGITGISNAITLQALPPGFATP